jgi:hypothetical protein
MKEYLNAWADLKSQRPLLAAVIYERVQLPNFYYLASNKIMFNSRIKLEAQLLPEGAPGEHPAV